MKTIQVVGSPSIQESLVFGYTDDKKAGELKQKLYSISLTGCRVLNIDMAFGHIIVAIPNPAINPMHYLIRNELIAEIKRIVEESENA